MLTQQGVGMVYFHDAGFMTLQHVQMQMQTRPGTAKSVYMHSCL